LLLVWGCVILPSGVAVGQSLSGASFDLDYGSGSPTDRLDIRSHDTSSHTFAGVLVQPTRTISITGALTPAVGGTAAVIPTSYEIAFTADTSSYRGAIAIVDDARLFIAGTFTVRGGRGGRSGAAIRMPFGPHPFCGVGTSARLTGFVDLHTHPLANLGFGGKLLYGGVDVGSLLPADPDCHHNVRATTMEQALGHDNSTHGGFGLFDNPCGDTLRDAMIHALQSANHASDPSGDARGAPDFVNWPVWNDITHQKMWVDWIRRAYDAGLRVMVALAVNNKTLGDATAGPGDYPTDDRWAADLQIAETKAFVARHADFMEIAYSSADLARIVSANKLAVVLGVEIDNVGNLHRVGPLTNAQISLEISRLYEEGIRYVFPIHIIDNPFGGTAAYDDFFNFSNFREAGHYWDLECAPAPDNPTEKITYNFDQLLSAAISGALTAAAFKLNTIFPPPPIYPRFCGQTNARGLTAQGEFALTDMIRRGMLIDVDHMSQKALNRALEIAQAVPNGGYPVNSGHSGLRGFVPRRLAPKAVTERSMTAAQYRRIGNLHGMAGVGSAELRADEWLQAYNAVVAALGNDAVAAFGTDTDGLALGMPAPSSPVVQYSAAFPKSRAGTKEWDYNVAGVAHYGMLADFLRDVQTRDGGSAVIQSMMRGADYFYRMWRRCEIQKANVH
jgi:microsomal dipeptidase-like Zn-dependent dipeptidase